MQDRLHFFHLVNYETATMGITSLHFCNLYSLSEYWYFNQLLNYLEVGKQYPIKGYKDLILFLTMQNIIQIRTPPMILNLYICYL